MNNNIRFQSSHTHIWQTCIFPPRIQRKWYLICISNWWIWHGYYVSKLRFASTPIYVAAPIIVIIIIIHCPYWRFDGNNFMRLYSNVRCKCGECTSYKQFLACVCSHHDIITTRVYVFKPRKKIKKCISENCTSLRSEWQWTYGPNIDPLVHMPSEISALNTLRHNTQRNQQPNAMVLGFWQIPVMRSSQLSYGKSDCSTAQPLLRSITSLLTKLNHKILCNVHSRCSRSSWLANSCVPSPAIHHTDYHWA